MKKYLVVIPTYNEEQNISKLISKIKDIDENLHVLVVDDNSPDGTAQRVQELAKKLPNLNLICRKNERGYGRACQEGFDYGLRQKFDYLLSMDADLSHNPEAIPQLLEKAERFDIVVGSRYIEGGQIVASWSWWRRLVSRSGNRIARFALGLPVKDCTSGYRCYRKEVLENIKLEEIESEGYSFLIELLYQAYNKGYQISEVPITYVDRECGKSKLSRRIILEALWLVTMLALRRTFTKKK